MGQTYAEATINNAKRTGKSVKEILEIDLTNDYKRAPKTIFNKHGIQLDWNEEKKIYEGIEKICLCGVGEQHHENDKCPAKNAKTKFKEVSSREWVASLQISKVPIFKTPCTQGECHGINYTPLHDNGTKFVCRLCGEENTAEIIVSPDSVAFPLVEHLTS